jgi:hypothetical protein
MEPEPCIPELIDGQHVGCGACGECQEQAETEEREQEEYR